MRTNAALVVVLGPLLAACGANDSLDQASADLTGLACAAPVAACEAPLDPGPASPWNRVASSVIVGALSPVHRGFDLVLSPDDAQELTAHFAYGLADKNLEGELVDVYLLRGCSGTWEKLSTEETAEGAVTVSLIGQQRLGVGRHRARFVVRGDLSSTDLFVQVIEPGTPAFVSDVDGTLTSSEYIEGVNMLTGAIPAVHEDAARVLNRLSDRGLLPVYLSSRPEQLIARTRQLIRERGLPEGIVRVHPGTGFNLREESTSFKEQELESLISAGLDIQWGFGNNAVESIAYETAVIPVEHRSFYQFDDDNGGARIESYGEWLLEAASVAPGCQ